MLVSHEGQGGPTITLVGQSQKRWKVEQVTWSFSAAPTTGLLQITGLDADDFSVDVTAGGPGALPLPRSAYGKVGGTVVVIASCAAGVTGKVNVFAELE